MRHNLECNKERKNLLQKNYIFFQNNLNLLGIKQSLDKYRPKQTAVNSRVKPSSVMLKLLISRFRYMIEFGFIHQLIDFYKPY